MAISACRQCGRSNLPLIHPPLALEDWLREWDDEFGLVLHPVAASLANHVPLPCLAFLVGLKGGLSDTGVKQTQAAGLHAMCLGPQVLRTETAPMVALAAAQQPWGDFV